MKVIVMFVMVMTIIHSDLLAKNKTSKETTEIREHMAKMLEQMAVCLRSHKTSVECHQEMKTNCAKIKDIKGCPMMKDMGGMMYLEGMHDDSKEPKNP
ncbi:MAG: hypothetical protein A2202_07540 [Bdellovibrionales bacterium RIFOXYA1_FULL_36_14]|nr:MAG: hypothetical protein A2202_07540 [Bdellovibrionales bacterium RIFOXYA1_FULL_36_14]